MRTLGAALLCGLTLSLCSGVALATDPIFLGRWSINPAGCKGFGQTAETTPLVVTDTSVEWFQSSCTIKKSYRIGEGLYLQAQCFERGHGRASCRSVCSSKGSKLNVTWDQTVAGEMQRCR